MLQAMRGMLKEELQPVNDRLDRIELDVSGLKQDVSDLKQDVSGLKEGQASLKQDVSGLKEGQVSLKQDITKININLENNIGKKIEALFDAHAIDSEKIDQIAKTVDDVQSSIVAIDIAAKMNANEIAKLKQKVG